MRVLVEPLRREHLPPVLGDIRPADLREWAAGTGSADMEACLELVFAEERYARCVVDEDGRLLCAWGVDAMAEDGDGWVWLFATNAAVPLFLPIHRHLKPELGEILARWPRLHAYADARNALHHKWLGWLGFEHREDVQLGPFGLTFKHYLKER